MEVVERAQLGEQSDHSITRQLLDWVYYHDSMSRFTLFHWRNQNPAVQITDKISHPVPPLLENKKVRNVMSALSTFANLKA